MLPFIDEEICQEVMNEMFQDVHAWRKSMIHYIKDENPEVNSVIVELANKTELDPKAVATGAYAVYKMLEIASMNEQPVDNIIDEK